MVTSRQLLAFLALLALLSTACRSEVSFEPAQEAAVQGSVQAEPAPVEASTSAPADPVVTPEPAPTVVDEPPAPVPFDGQPPAAFSPPDGWDEPLALDPTVRQGTLPNGLTYLVRSNQRPGDQAQLRLVVHAGSLNEEAGTEGSAHFLEHMMFNGTERFPDNDIVQVLESFGSSFGPDVNAYTSFGETVYELQVPARSNDTLQLGLDVLFQWATAATIEPQAVIAERGVVREEHRRATEPLSGRIGREIRDVLFDKTDYLDSEPIGSAEVIESMTDVELRVFYQSWYRPELMTVVAVGDFNADEMVQRIEQTFVQPVSADPAEPLIPDVGAGVLPEPVFDVLTDSETQSPEIEVLWRLGDSSVYSRDDVRRDFVISIALSMLNTRLFEQVQTGTGVFLSANAAGGSFTPQMQLVSMTAGADVQDISTALQDLLVEMERARQFGFTQEELDRELDGLRLTFAQIYSESSTRQDEEFAQALVQHGLFRRLLLSPDDQRDIANQVLDTITLQDAQRFLFEVLATDPYVLLTAPAAVEQDLPEPEDLAEIYERVVGNQVDETQRFASTATELMTSPEPAQIVDRTSIDPLEATVVTYENGARLIYRQTPITENVVFMRAISHGGYFAVDGPEVPLLDGAAGMVAGSGFETIDVVTLDRLLSGSIASLGSSIGRAQENLSGESSTQDLETLFQLVHLQMTEPTISDLRVRQFEERWRPVAENPASDPSIAGDLELWDLRYGDSPWFRLIPTVQDLDDLDPDLLLAAYRDRFADAGDFTFAVVGDFDPDKLVDLGARYLGTLPDSGRRELPIDRDPGVPEENLVATVEAGIGDQGRVRINWESPYPFTLESDVTAQALELVVNARLRDLIREELGASYSPRASVSVLSTPKSWVDTIIEVESDPRRVDEVSETVHGELDRIRDGILDEQYLDLAVEQLSEHYRFATNNQWLDLLIFHSQYPERPAGEFRDRIAIAESLTVADIAAAAQVVFPSTRSVEVRLIPAS